MTTDDVDEPAILSRISDSFYINTTFLLALTDEPNPEVMGRIEYHFYVCMQDRCRMAYADWVYTLPKYRRQGTAQALFQVKEKDCRAHKINQFYLIRATNPEAERFYNKFKDSATLILRKEL